MPGEVIGVIDSRQAGRTAQDVLGFGGKIPVFSDLRTSLQRMPDTLLIGIAPTGGRLPDSWRATINEAIDNHLDIISGLHAMLKDDNEFSKRASCNNVRIVDLRYVSPEYELIAKGRDRKSTRLNSSHIQKSRMPSSA